MKTYDATIIGASIAGNRIADILSKNHDVLLIEEHKKIGLPVQCAGLVSFRLLKLLPKLPKNIILNQVERARFFSPNGNCMELKSKNPQP